MGRKYWVECGLPHEIAISLFGSGVAMVAESDIIQASAIMVNKLYFEMGYFGTGM